MTYQYTNFGVPGLGLKRGLAQNTVIAPYATLLAAQFMPREAVDNLARLKALGALGRYGYLRRRRLHAAARAGGRRPRRGLQLHGASSGHVDRRGRQRRLRRPHARPLPQRSGDRGGRTAAAGKGAARHSGRDRPHRSRRTDQAAIVVEQSPDTRLVLEPGGGAALHQPDVERPLFGDGDGDRLRLQPLERPRDHALAGRPDRGPARHLSSSCATSRPANGGRRQPSRRRPRANSARRCFATTRRASSRLSARSGPRSNASSFRKATAKAAASPSSMTGSTDRQIEVTSFAELVLAPEAADNAHPAFSKMFVETEISPNRRRHLRAPAEARRQRGRISRRRISSPIRPAAARGAEAETDRRAFIGRGRTIANPAAFDPGARLGGHHGFTLDPVVSLRRRVRVRANKKVSLTFWTVVGAEPRRGRGDDGRLDHPEGFPRQAMLAWTRSQVQTRHMGLSLADAANVQKLASYLIYPDPFLRLPAGTIASGLGRQSALWPMSISGDYPIFAGQDRRRRGSRNRRQCAAVPGIHAGARPAGRSRHRQRAGLVLCAGSAAGDRSAVREQPAARQGTRAAPAYLRGPPRPDGREFLPDAAVGGAGGAAHPQRPHLRPDRTCRGGRACRRATPAGAWKAKMRGDRQAGRRPPSRRLAAGVRPTAADLQLWNGFGGFDRDGRDYVVRLGGERTTPHPWINVISNQSFGFHTSAEGASFTWSRNSRDFQLTPWSNDPVDQPAGRSDLRLRSCQRPGVLAVRRGRARSRRRSTRRGTGRGSRASAPSAARFRSNSRNSSTRSIR